MALVVCSTSVCRTSGPAGSVGPPAVLDRWERLCSGLADALAIDARNNPHRQEMLLAQCETRQLRCVELAHPLQGPEGLPAASPASPDPHEQRAALQQLAASLRRAADHEIGRVILFPSPLDLRPSWVELARSWAEGRSIAAPLAQLADERQARAEPALAGLCLVLERALRLAQDLGVELVLPLPVPWPHQIPDGAEVLALRETLSGAPLGSCLATDWWHTRRQLLGPAEELEPPVPEPLSCIRVADACGLTPMLPLDSGEIEWPGPVAGLGSASLERHRVLAFWPEPTRAEMEASRTQLDRLFSRGDA